MKRFNWSEEERIQYQTIIAEQLKYGCILVCLLALTMFPLFGILDYLTQREYLDVLLRIRVIAFIFYGLLFICIRFFSFNTNVAVGVISLSASFFITQLCNVGGGFESPYYSGIFLVILGTVAVYPVGIFRVTLLIFLEITVYVIGCLAHENFVIRNPVYLYNNLFTLSMSAIMGIISCWWLENNRKISFETYLELEKNRRDLRNSIELLQKDLESEQVNVEMLVKEITNRNADLERALDLRKEFISLASHELNTPLTSLKLITQMVKYKMSKNEEINEGIVRKLLNVYDEQVIRLTRIVKDMLDVSRIENGKLNLEKIEFDLNLIIKDIIEFSSIGYPSEIRFISDGSVIGSWDKIRIEQVMLNLLSNAIKYGKGLPIEVYLSSNEHEVQIKVKDYGIGIPEELQQRIFDRFERAVNPYQFSGLGIGLYIAHQIILGHSGKLSVSSKPGVGAEFIVTLPLKM